MCIALRNYSFWKGFRKATGWMLVEKLLWFHVCLHEETSFSHLAKSSPLQFEFATRKVQRVNGHASRHPTYLRARLLIEILKLKQSYRSNQLNYEFFYPTRKRAVNTANSWLQCHLSQRYPLAPLKILPMRIRKTSAKTTTDRRPVTLPLEV
jgi:hypothetical protein